MVQFDFEQLVCENQSNYVRTNNAYQTNNYLTKFVKLILS